MTLSYCYRTGEGRPCSRLLLCWEEIMPRLRAVLRKLFPEEEFHRLFETPPTPKMVTLVELARKVERSLPRTEESEEREEDLPRS